MDNNIYLESDFDADKALIKYFDVGSKIFRDGLTYSLEAIFIIFIILLEILIMYKHEMTI